MKCSTCGTDMHASGRWYFQPPDHFGDPPKPPFVEVICLTFGCGRSCWMDDEEGTSLLAKLPPAYRVHVDVLHRPVEPQLSPGRVR